MRRKEFLDSIEDSTLMYQHLLVAPADNKLRLHMAFSANNFVAFRNPSVMVFVLVHALVISTAFHALAWQASDPVVMPQARLVLRPAFEAEFQKTTNKDYDKMDKKEDIYISASN